MSLSSVVSFAHSAIEGLAALLAPVGGLAPALAIVLFTVLIRLVISPLGYLQVRAMRRREALAPQVEKLKEKHADDPAAMAAEVMALHRANGAGLMVGLLPGLAQTPFFMLMYQVALDPPAGALAGVALTAHLSAGWPVFVVLLAVSAAVAAWSARRLTGPLRVLPWLTLPMVAWMPLAGAVYLVTSTAWTAAEQALLRRFVTV